MPSKSIILGVGRNSELKLSNLADAFTWYKLYVHSAFLQLRFLFPSWSFVCRTLCGEKACVKSTAQISMAAGGRFRSHSFLDLVKPVKLNNCSNYKVAWPKMNSQAVSTLLFCHFYESHSMWNALGKNTSAICVHICKLAMSSKNFKLHWEQLKLNTHDIKYSLYDRFSSLYDQVNLSSW